MSHLGEAHPLADPRVLLGTWCLRRAVVDRRAGRIARARGTLVLAAGADGALTWTERMELEWAGGRYPASRAYLVTPEDDGWMVRFDDGRPFHAWAPGAPLTHPCGGDLYAGRVDGVPRRWTVRWEVRGPRKDQGLGSLLTPAA